MRLRLAMVAAILIALGAGLEYGVKRQWRGAKAPELKPAVKLFDPQSSWGEGHFEPGNSAIISAPKWIQPEYLSYAPHCNKGDILITGSVGDIFCKHVIQKKKKGIVLPLSYKGAWSSPVDSIKWMNPHQHVTISQLLAAFGQDEHPCILNIQLECWVTLDPEPPAKVPTCKPNENAWAINGGDVACVQYTEPEGGTWSVERKAREYDQLLLDHDQVFYDDVFVPNGDCTARERYRELQCQMGGKCGERNKDVKTWCIGTAKE